MKHLYAIKCKKKKECDIAKIPQQNEPTFVFFFYSGHQNHHEAGGLRPELAMSTFGPRRRPDPTPPPHPVGGSSEV
jgi:hypothetical protein